MNKNKLYTIFSPPDDRFTVSPQAVIAEHRTREFCEIHKIPEKDRTLEKFELLDKRGLQLPEKRRAESFLPPSQAPFIN